MQLLNHQEETLQLNTNSSGHVPFNPRTDNGSDISSIRSVSSFALVNSLRSSVDFSLERALAKARVYQKAIRNTSTTSFKTITTSESNWLQLTGLNLSQISTISVTQLPMYNSYLFSHKEARTGKGWTVLHEAAASGETARVRQIIETTGTIKDTRENGGRTALHYAAFHGHTTTVRQLIELDADKEAKTSYGSTVLQCAAVHGHDSTVRQLLELGVKVDTSGRNGWTALHYAAFSGHDDTVWQLIAFGADTEKKASSGWTALHYTAFNGFSTTV
jgi:hypothetical protein